MVLQVEATPIFTAFISLLKVSQHSLKTNEKIPDESRFSLSSCDRWKLPLDNSRKSLDSLLDPSLVEWVLGSSWCIIKSGLMWQEYTGNDWPARSTERHRVAPQTVQELIDTLVRIWDETPSAIS
ncbi:hypothetical protein CRENBAI_006445 [Crenichthys baileyi]|uniref:Uncharacterized protein n=1 Tax=Crenichthys baileyi TaxID=28760 RepID=A0AAV9RDX3_9TELE